MKKIMEKGDGYVVSEIARLEKMLLGVSVMGEKRDNMYRRKNVLNVFKDAGFATKDEL